LDFLRCFYVTKVKFKLKNELNYKKSNQTLHEKNDKSTKKMKKIMFAEKPVLLGQSEFS